MFPTQMCLPEKEQLKKLLVLEHELQIQRREKKRIFNKHNNYWKSYNSFNYLILEMNNNACS